MYDYVGLDVGLSGDPRRRSSMHSGHRPEALSVSEGSEVLRLVARHHRR